MSTPPLETDPEGFLVSREDWNLSVAQHIAQLEGISLQDEHWEVINLVRDYYATHRLFPPNRVLVKQMKIKLGENQGSSIHLMTLFTGKPARVLAKISGLPKPPNCD